MNPATRLAVVDGVPNDTPVAVALGGGADSALLAAVVVDVVGVEHVRGVFVHHHLEGSDMLFTSAADLCRRLDIGLTVLDGPIEEGPDLEARARHVRYRLIGDQLGEREICCTAHTANDQAETVLMRMMRGSGTSGISGIPVARHPFYRPFLGLSRAEIRAEADALALPYADDPSNADRRFLRSRIRNELIPIIESQYSEGFGQNLVRTAELAGSDDVVLEQQAAEVPLVVDDGAVLVPVGALASIPRAVSTRVVRRALGSFHGPYRGTFTDVLQVLRTAHDGLTRTLSGDVLCFVEGPHVALAPKDDRMFDSDRSIEVGDRFGWGGAEFVVRAARRPSDFLLSDVRTTVAAPKGAALGIRTPTDGDRLDLVDGTTPVTEILRAHGVPPRKRGNWMLITVGGRIAAVRGIRIAPWARPGAGRRDITIELEGHS
jgi:tRNA(Ile)-lysidine synthase